MAGRGNKTSLQSLLDDLKLEEVQEQTGLFDDDRLPIQEPLQAGFVAWINSIIHEIEPRFAWSPATHLMAEEIEMAVHGRAARLMMVPHPRSGKSLLMCFGFVYSVMCYPDRPQILISASQRLAQGHSRKILEIFKAAGGKLHPRSKSVTEWMPGWRHGSLQAVIGRTGSVLGLGASVLWIDDVVGSRADSMSATVMDATMEMYGSSWASRLQKDRSGKGESIVLVNQRLSSTDLAGQLINRAKARGKGTPWRVVHIPIVFPEKASETLNWYPDWWLVRQLQGPEGRPTQDRFDPEFIDEQRLNMSPAAFNALFMGDVRDDGELCPWKENYIKTYPLQDLEPGSICLALDLAITGEADGHGYCVIASGNYSCRGKAIILEAGELKGAVDLLIPQIVELVRKYKCSTVAVEKAGGAFAIMRDLNAGLSGFGVNVEQVTHGGKGKFARLEPHIGYAALGNILAPQGTSWLPILNQQLRAIASKQDRQRDDIGDAFIYGLSVVRRWISGGFILGTATWGRAGFTEKPVMAQWGRGTSHKGYGADSQYELPDSQAWPGPATWER